MNPTTWNELLKNIGECPFCKRILWKDAVVDHLKKHEDKIAKIQTIFVECDKQDLDPPPARVYICPYDNIIPLDTFKGNPTDAIIRHIESTHKRRPIRFSVVRDIDSLKIFIEKVKNGQEFKLVLSWFSGKWTRWVALIVSID